jgi:hypothetical protein
VRIPFEKVYRAFPEFDRFSDQRCEAYLRYVRERYAWMPLATVVLWIGGFLLGAMCGMLSFVWARRLLPRALWKATVGSDDTGVSVVSSVVLLAVSIGVPVLLAVIVRDRLLRTVLRKQLRGVECKQCGYSLLGAAVTEGCVQCPECGHAFAIFKHGLTPKDFDVRAENDLPAAAEPPKPIELDWAEKQRLIDRLREGRAARGEDRGSERS